MLTSTTLPTTPVVFHVDVTAWSNDQRTQLLEQISSIEQTRRDTPAEHPTIEPSAPAAEPTGWTVDAYVDAVSGLLRRHGVQANVINEAIRNGTGYVSRDRVYEIGGYAPSRSLKGFTRPVNRITQDLVDKGVLPDDAADLLTPDYDENQSGYQRAKGFIVPAEVVELMEADFRKRNG